jgi:hypothetical protein
MRESPFEGAMNRQQFLSSNLSVIPLAEWFLGDPGVFGRFLFEILENEPRFIH